MPSRRVRYSPWDGTQSGFDLDSFGLMGELSDELLSHGDVNAALRKVLQQGLTDAEGRRLEGLADMIEKLRAQREALAAQYNLSGVVDDLAEQLREIIDLERDYMDRQSLAAMASGEEEWSAAAEERFFENRMKLDLLPPSLADQMSELSDYDFASPEAAEKFAALQDELREQLLGNVFEGLSKSMAATTPEDMARMNAMLSELNEMIEARDRGEEPDFDGFMERHGDLVPGDPKNLDELLANMAQQFAASQALMNSLDPAQRAELMALAEQMMGDMDMSWQFSQLQSNLQGLFPHLGWTQGYSMDGMDPLGFGGARDLFGQLGELDRLENLMRSASSPGALGEIDLDAVRDLLGQEAADSLQKLSELSSALQSDGLVYSKDGEVSLTPQGLRRLGQHALAQVFRRLDPNAIGRHEQPQQGAGHERTYQTKPYEYGDPFALNIERTLGNAVRRRASESADEGGATSAGSRSVRLLPEDFEIDTTEKTVRCATVLLLDLSYSMPMRGYFLPAKRVALALHALMAMQFPGDYLGIVGFAKSAYALSPLDLPKVSWDTQYGTNMEHALSLARGLLAPQRGTKQIIMITDGEPTAHRNPRTGNAEFYYPPVAETLAMTMSEVSACTRAGIRINTFMLEPDAGLRRFVERLTEINKGRAFFATPGDLGDFLLVDFLERRREMVRKAR